MKTSIVYIGILVHGSDELTADVLMNYAMNSLNIKNTVGIISNVEVREIRVPNIVDSDKIDNQMNKPDFGHLM